MNAHSFAMQNLFVAFGFTLMNQIGIFGTSVSRNAGFFDTIKNALTDPVVTIAGIQITGILLIAGALAATTIVILNTNLVTAQGTSMVIYASIFFGSIFLVGMDIYEILGTSSPFTTIISTFYGAYALFGSLAFLYMLVQMSSGGQKMMD